MQKCAVSHCPNVASSRTEGSYCYPHYQQAHRGADPEQYEITQPGAPCDYAGCDRMAQSNMLCKYHAGAARQGLMDLKPEWGVRLNPPCVMEGCTRRATSRRSVLCHPHYLAEREFAARERIYTSRQGPCVIEGCDQQRYAKGLCAWHRKQHSAGVPLTPRPAAGYNTCQFAGCDRRSSVYDHCATHRRQYEETGRMWQIGDRYMGLGKPEKQTKECPISWCAERIGMRSTLCQNHARTARTYGLSPDRLVEVCAPGECSACGSTEGLSIDHDHACCPGDKACGECVRGLLCNSCNWALGRVKDRPEVLRALIDYLEAA